MTFGASPTLESIYPAGASCGTTNAISISGKFESWPPKAWIGGEGVIFTPETNKGKFTVVIATNAPPGARLLRLYNEEGSSEPRAFVVARGKEVTEIEPNNHYQKAQRVEALPVTTNGRLEKGGDVDSFHLQLRAGEWLDASADCYRLQSKVDPVLRLVSTNGQQLAWNHDGATLDPRLVWRAPSDTSVVLQVFGFTFPPAADINFTGGEATVYRLHLASSGVEPLAPSGSAPDSHLPEHEPNDANAHPVQLPVVVSGLIAARDDEDRFRVVLAKGTTIEARVDATGLGSSLDAWLRIEDGARNQIASNDDADGSADPRIEWKVPTNGTYLIAVGSVTHRGGADYRYTLSVRPLEPDYTATIAAPALSIAPGSTNELKLEIKRLRGFTNDLAVTTSQLPPGVTLLTTNVTKDGSVSLQLAAAPDVKQFQGPISVFLADSATRAPRAIPFKLTTAGETGYNHLLVESNEDVWVTVLPKPVAK